MEEKNKNKPQQIKIEIDDAVGQGEYVNFAIVHHSIAEFIIDFIKILPGDIVKLEISPYDLTRGRITYRNK